MNKSLYKNTSVDNNYMYYYNPVVIPEDETDYIIKIDKKYVCKPGLLAYDLYGDESLMWIFRYFNNNIINDLIFDLKEGIYIRVPTKERLLKYV